MGMHPIQMLGGLMNHGSNFNMSSQQIKIDGAIVETTRSEMKMRNGTMQNVQVTERQFDERRAHFDTRGPIGRPYQATIVKKPREMDVKYFVLSQFPEGAVKVHTYKKLEAEHGGEICDTVALKNFAIMSKSDKGSVKIPLKWNSS